MAYIQKYIDVARKGFVDIFYTTLSLFQKLNIKFSDIGILLSHFNCFTINNKIPFVEIYKKKILFSFQSQVPCHIEEYIVYACGWLAGNVSPGLKAFTLLP